jgi:cytochrome c-type biogenesis protein CcmH
MLFSFAFPTAAQDVTDDQVNEVASKLYCPVCENIPLDACATPACQQWRSEIRAQLADGMSEQQVIDDFVSRFGDRVVGTPVDPMLRALVLITPWVIGALAVLVALWTLLRWRMSAAGARQTAEAAREMVHDDEYYRARIEQDLQARR